MTTVHPNTPEPRPALVEEIVGQLHAAGVTTSDNAVRVLAIHAHRSRLTYDQVVAILARFTPTLWHPDVQRRAAELLEDIGQTEHWGPTQAAALVQQLRLDVQAARDDAPWRVLPSGDVDFSALVEAGEPVMPAPVSALVIDLEAAIEQYETSVPVAHLRLILGRYRERLQEYGRRAGHDPG